MFKNRTKAVILQIFKRETEQKSKKLLVYDLKSKCAILWHLKKPYNTQKRSWSARRRIKNFLKLLLSPNFSEKEKKRAELSKGLKHLKNRVWKILTLCRTRTRTWNFRKYTSWKNLTREICSETRQILPLVLYLTFK